MKILIIFIVVLLISNCIFFASMLFYRKASLHDELTALPNFRALKLFLKSNLNFCYIGLVILDIDNFKDFNRINIHKGDEVLIEFSKVIKDLLNQNSNVFRYRLGDEFTLVFRNKSKEEIKIEMKKIQSYFQLYSFKCLPEKKNYRICFCYGISELAANYDKFNSLFETAEHELANAKYEKAEISNCFDLKKSV